ncbi:Bud site selection protein bud4 [Malassezia psittaci]|uniref:Bud site selection protein bud4 n=1 Tax=Malassezia psittaci TaxID=1821823 RepID=A0AAF0F8E8_9BASI|nr:Bud site selection protein bud4 [Malassezia psittaci]
MTKFHGAYAPEFARGTKSDAIRTQHNLTDSSQSPVDDLAKGLGLGIVLEPNAWQTSPQRVPKENTYHPASDSQKESSFKKNAQIPSLATTDRIVIDDVLKHYSPPKPGDESFTGTDVSMDFDVSRDSQVAPAIIDAYAHMPRSSRSNLYEIQGYAPHISIAEVPEEVEESDYYATKPRNSTQSAYEIDMKTPTPMREAPPIPTTSVPERDSVPRPDSATVASRYGDVDVLLADQQENPIKGSSSFQGDEREQEAPKTQVAILSAPFSTDIDSVTQSTASVASQKEPSRSKSKFSTKRKYKHTPGLAAPALNLSSLQGISMPFTKTAEPRSGPNTAQTEPIEKPTIEKPTSRPGPSFNDTQQTVIERVSESYERHDTSSLSAAERVENLVDQLLNDDFFMDPDAELNRNTDMTTDISSAAKPKDASSVVAVEAMTTSPSIRRLSSVKQPETIPPLPSSAPKLASPDLPTLPSWSPITWEGVLPKDASPRKRTKELPMRTIRPHITRDTVRQRMDMRKQDRTSRTPIDGPWTSSLVSDSSRPLRDSVKDKENQRPMSQASAAPALERSSTPLGSQFTGSNAKPLPSRPSKTESKPNGAANALNLNVAQLKELGPVASTRHSLDMQRPLASPLTRMETDLKRRATTSGTLPQDEFPTSNLSSDIHRQASWFNEQKSPRGTDTAEQSINLLNADTTQSNGIDTSGQDLVDDLLLDSSTRSTTNVLASNGEDDSSVDRQEPRAEANEQASAPSEPEGPFGHLLERELSRIVTESEKKYKVRDRGVFQSNSPEVRQQATFAAQNDDLKPWQRLRKPNEVEAFRRTSGQQASKASNQKLTTGRTFVMIDSFIPHDLPLPKEPTSFYCILDNGIHVVKTASSALYAGPDGLCPIQQEFELLEHPDLTISFTIMLQMDPHLYDSAAETGVMNQRQSNSQPRTGVGKLLNPFQTRTGGTTRSRFLSKTQKPSLLQFATSQGALGQSVVSLDAVKSKCYARSMVLDLPVRAMKEEFPHPTQTSLMDTDRQRTHDLSFSKPRGTLRLRLFYLPPLPDSLTEQLPRNLAECEEGMQNVSWHESGATYKGTLTQLGGDCKIWRRRPMRIMGMNLICFNEVTKRPTTRIDLMQTLAIEDCAKLRSDELEDMVDMLPDKRSFRITFRDGEKIYFFADSPTEMRQWLQALQTILVHKLEMPPDWSQAAYASANEYYGLPQPSSKTSSAPSTSTVRATVVGASSSESNGANARVPRSARKPAQNASSRSEWNFDQTSSELPKADSNLSPTRPKRNNLETAQTHTSPTSPTSRLSNPKVQTMPTSSMPNRSARKPPPTSPTESRPPPVSAQQQAPKSTPNGTAAVVVPSQGTESSPVPRPSEEPIFQDQAKATRSKSKTATMAKAKQFFSRDTHTRDSQTKNPSRWSLNFSHTKPLRPF